jgi:hypothetical protein
MLNAKTVFILGAGASIPYDFPSGLKLVREIVQVLGNLKTNDPTLYTTFLEMGIEADELNNFHDALLGSHAQSVDAFLEHNPKYLRVGKAAIAARLIPYEKPIALLYAMQNNTAGEWYSYMFNRLATDFDAYIANQVAFLTFNYDRSLEHFLLGAIKNMHGRSEQESIDKLNAMPIIHLHGSLGKLPHESEMSRAYEPTISAKTLEIAMKEIRIVSEEDAAGDRVFSTAQYWLAQAQIICLLGFGFHETNIRRLNLSQFIDRPRWTIGSAFDLHPAEQVRAMRYLTGSRSGPLPNFELGGKDEDCLTFLRRRFEWW